MDFRKIAIPFGIIALITGVMLESNPKTASVMAETALNVTPDPEKLFGGIPLSKLDDLAKSIHRGLWCSIDKGFLIFHHKSNRGHQTFHTQMTIDSMNKLINLGGHYPGQWWSTADEFAKRANELFLFSK